MIRRVALTATLILGIVCYGSASQANERQEATVTAATSVLVDMMSLPVSRIPESMLRDVQGIAIIPNVIKGGFVIGARHGNGVVLVRDEDGHWQAPSFVSLTGGNVGWQFGVQSTDVVLVFKSRSSVDNLLSGRLTLGADAAIAAGPVGRKAAAATDLRLKSEIYSYSRSRGIFLGVSIDGSVLRSDPYADASYYAASAPGQIDQVPASALRLVEKVTFYTDGQQAELGEVTTGPTLAPPATTSTEPDVLRQQLAQIALKLYQRLDDSWQTYLALPAEVYGTAQHPSAEALEQTLARFDQVQSNSDYRALSDRSEFRSTHALLQHYVEAFAKREPRLALPPPPQAAERR